MQNVSEHSNAYSKARKRTKVLVLPINTTNLTTLKE